MDSGGLPNSFGVGGVGKVHDCRYKIQMFKYRMVLRSPYRGQGGKPVSYRNLAVISTP